MSIEGWAATIIGVIGILQVLILYFASRSASKTTKIEEHLATLNGRVGRSETWREQHEKMDDQRHHENLQKFDKIFDKLD